MAGNIFQYLVEDHLHLGDALRRATERSHVIEPLAYSEFRAGLLRHIGIEEKNLVASRSGGTGWQTAVHSIVTVVRG
jgi:hypothetical protein